MPLLFLKARDVKAKLPLPVSSGTDMLFASFIFQRITSREEGRDGAGMKDRKGEWTILYITLKHLRHWAELIQVVILLLRVNSRGFPFHFHVAHDSP